MRAITALADARTSVCPRAGRGSWPVATRARERLLPAGGAIAPFEPLLVRIKRERLNEMLSAQLAQEPAAGA